jgi:hypothetical protein
MSTQLQNKLPALTINQRNLYSYYLAHKKKHGNTPCFVPKCPTQVSRLEQYLTALIKLEQYGLIRVDRTSVNYTAWLMLPPHNVSIVP